MKLNIQFDVSERGWISQVKSAITGNVIDRLAFCAVDSVEPMYILITDSYDAAAVFTAIPDKRSVAVLLTDKHPRFYRKLKAERIFPTAPHSVEVAMIDACAKL